VVHCGSLYSFAARDRVQMRRVNVDGTAGLLAAAHIAGVERAVLTASAGIGQKSFYHRSKLHQERAALASRVPVVALMPTAPVGPSDWKPTPTGRMVLDFARGKMFARPPAGGGMNLVAVEDVARAHVSALERGRIGERYIIGGENLSFDRIWELLAAASGRTAPRWHAPRALALGVGWIDELRCRLNPAATPFAPLEGVRLSSKEIYADSTQAQRAFGYESQPVYGALERAVAWYSANGYIS
jgi:dihydroflavonol-4-reductase